MKRKTLSSLSLISLSLSQIVTQHQELCVLSSLASNLSPPSVLDPLLLCTYKTLSPLASLSPSAALHVKNLSPPSVPQSLYCTAITKRQNPLASLSPLVPLLLCNYKTLSPPSASLIFVPLVKGVPKLAFVPFLTHKRHLGLGLGLSKKMSSSMENCYVDVQNKLEVVRPATEVYAQEAIEALKAGKVIAVPTDTLYGFACDACSLEAVSSIYEMKGRKHTSPLAICVGDVSHIQHFAVTEYLPHGLLDSLLPGPVTVILRRGESSALEKSLNPGLDSVGVRVPDCNFIRAVARGLGKAVALTSANLSGQPSSLCIKDFENLWNRCAYVYDGGALPSNGAGSTIVDLTLPGKYKILRPGSAREETLAILEKHSLVEEAPVI